ncbi:MAG: hypothetical protein Q7S92_04665 [Candidatus Diapherotrites archaeon]|nr:hypothetical protein [Candidatus Diapherotrites archaeon]
MLQPKRSSQEMFKALMRLTRIADKLGIQYCFVGSTLPFIETKVRRLTDIDLVVESPEAAARLFNSANFRDPDFEFNLSKTPALARAGQYFARAQGIRFDIYTKDLGGMPVSLILQNKSVHTQSRFRIPLVSRDLYFVLKTLIQPFAEIALTGRLKKGTGRGNSGKKDLFDLTLMHRRVDLAKVRELASHLSPEIRARIDANIAFIQKPSKQGQKIIWRAKERLHRAPRQGMGRHAIK